MTTDGSLDVKAGGSSTVPPKVRRVDHVIQQLTDELRAGRLKPGDRIPPELELAQWLGVSRGSVREAVSALALIRVLEVKQGDGTYVAASPMPAAELVKFMLELYSDNDAVLEMLEVRRYLEAAATAKAAYLADQQTIHELRMHLARVTYKSKLGELIDNDIEFHSKVNSVCENDVMIAILRSMSSSTRHARLWNMLTFEQEEGSAHGIIREHHQIVDAIELKDPNLAAARAAAHVSAVELRIRRSLGILEVHDEPRDAG